MSKVIRGPRQVKPGASYFWTAEEIQFLRDNHEAMSALDIAEHLGRSEMSVMLKTSRLGYKEHVNFTQEEDDYLREAFANTPIETILLALPDRNEKAIVNRAKKIGLRRSKEFIRDKRSYTMEELALPAIAFKKQFGAYPLMRGYGTPGGWQEELAQQTMPHVHTYRRTFGSMPGAWRAIDEYGLDQGLLKNDQVGNYRGKFGRILPD